jgi:hypothetical protein
LNALFSESLIDEFSALNDKRSREELDRQGGGKGKHIWVNISEQFNDKENDLDYRLVLFLDDEHVASAVDKDLNPTKFKVFTWSTPSATFMDCMTELEKARKNFTISGEHDSDFFNFCHGKKQLASYCLLYNSRKILGWKESSLPVYPMMSSWIRLEIHSLVMKFLKIATRMTMRMKVQKPRTQATMWKTATRNQQRRLRKDVTHRRAF